ncbi:MAG: DNA mismatch repair endonuclease MutL [Shewanella sp.]
MGIQILPPQLANQIAAGEVVERPASVVKELVENSLDAGASRVDIDIDKGGSKLIKIRDNGSGIPKEELALALSRHATSKLHTLDDLEAILSFGFRGEALASISSVSRLSLTSRTAEQTEAWQAHAEGADMAVKVMPAAHPIGSTIEVVDLFFNTPARRRFLKSDKTEFTHIDEWLKRIALVRGDIHFTLTHNGKTVRNYRPAMNEAQYLQRLTQVCGRPFAEQALKIECQHDDLRLSGYLQSPWSPVISDTHYFYVNGRLIRDRLVNHAVRQAFAQKAALEQPGYVLMLDIDPHQVDVNVHPAKHEVRFHQSRYVHDYILQALQSALEEAGELNFVHSRSLDEVDDVFVDAPISTAGISAPFALGDDSAQVNAPADILQPAQHSAATAVQVQSVVAGREGASLGIQTNAFGSMATPRDSSRGSYSTGESRQRTELPSKAAIASYGALLQTPCYSVKDQDYQPSLPMPAILDGQYWVMAAEHNLSLLSIKSVALATRCQEIEAKLATGLIGQPLLMPVSVAADADWQAVLTEHATLIRQLGLELTIRYQQLIIKKVPPYLRESQLAKVIPEWLQSLRFETPAPSALAFWLAKHSLTGFVSAPEIWAAFSLLAEEKKQLIANKAIFLPWQSWLEEQASE